MAIKNFFDGLGDSTLESTAALKSPDLYIQEEIYSGKMTYASAGQTFTVLTGTPFTIDELISAGVQNILVKDDNGLVASTIITDNTASSVTIVATNLLLENDEATSATLTDATVYDVRILTPGTSAQPYGKFLGYVEGLDLQISDEYAKFKYPDAPKKLIFKDIIERTVQLTGGSVNLAKKDILQTIFNSSEYGDNTGGAFNLGIGSNPITKTFRLWAVGTTRIGNPLIWKLRRCQFESTGSVLGSSESGHKMVNWMVDCLADPFYPDSADYLQIIGTDV